MTRTELRILAEYTINKCFKDELGYIPSYSFRVTPRQGHARLSRRTPLEVVLSAADGDPLPPALARRAVFALSVPAWAALGHRGASPKTYVRYYAAHESAHVITFLLWGNRNVAAHGPEFKAMERLLCGRFGIQLEFECESDPYPIRIIGTKEE